MANIRWKDKTQLSAPGGSDRLPVTDTADGNTDKYVTAADLVTKGHGLGDGVVKVGSGVMGAAAEGTDYYAPGGTDVAIGDGGTGASTQQGALDAITNAGGGTSGQVLKTDGTNVSWGDVSGGVSWGDSISGTSGTGLEINEYGSDTQATAHNIYGMCLAMGDKFNTNSSYSTRLVYIDVEENTGSGHNAGIYVSNWNTESDVTSMYGVGLGMLQMSSGGTACAIRVGNQGMNNSTDGQALHLEASGMQSNAGIIQKIDLGASDYGHTGLWVLNEADGTTESTAVRVDLGAAGTGKGLEVVGGNATGTITDYLTLSALKFKRFRKTVTLDTVDAETDVGLTPGGVILAAAIRVSTEIGGLDSNDHHIKLGVSGTTDKYCDASEGSASTSISVDKGDSYGFDPTKGSESGALVLTVDGGADNTPTGGAVEVEVVYLGVEGLV